MADIQTQLQNAQAQLAQLQLQNAQLLQQLGQRQLKVNKPETYNGGSKNIDTFLFSCTQYFDASGLTIDQQKIAFASTYLKGVALDWWRVKKTAAVNGQGTLPQTWAEFEHELKSRFARIAEEDFARGQLRRMTQHKGVSAYNTAFNNVVLKIPSMDERSKLDQYLLGLKDEPRKYVRLQRPTTLELAMALAEEYESGELQDRLFARNIKQRASNRDFNTAHDPMEIDSARMDKPKRSKHAKQHSASGSKGSSRSSGRQSGKDRTVPECWNCGKRGHISRDCTKPKKGKGKVNAAKGSESYSKSASSSYQEN